MERDPILTINPFFRIFEIAAFFSQYDWPERSVMSYHWLRSDLPYS